MKSEKMGSLRPAASGGLRSGAQLCDRVRRGAWGVAGLLGALLASAPLAGQTDGSPRWAYAALPSSTAGSIISAASVAPDGTVYVGLEIGGVGTTAARGRIIALTKDGAQKWAYDTPDWIDSTPVVGADGTIYFGCWDSRLYALRPDGTLRWSFRAGGQVSASPALGDNGEIYFGSGNGNLYALNADGTQKWVFPSLFWIDAAPAVGPDGAIYFGSLDNSFYAVNPDGTLRWLYTTGGDIVAAPAIAGDGTVYFGSRDQKLHALAPDGSVRWTFAVTDTIEASPVLAEDGSVIFATTGGRVFCVSPEGTEKWRYPRATQPALSAVFSTPAVRSDGSIVFGSSDNALFALRSDGTLLWRAPLGDWADAPVCVAPDGAIYIGALDKKLYAFNGTPQAAATEWPQFGRSPRRTAKQVIGQTFGTTGRLANLSVRATAGPGADTLIVGLVTGGTGSRTLLLRGIGPTLANFGVGGVLPNPQLTLFSGGAILDSNDDWEKQANPLRVATLAAQVGAFPLAAQAADAALVTTLNPDTYTVHVSAPSGLGVALVEAYDAGGAGTARLVNVSTRTLVRSGGGPLIAGFVVGENSLTLLIRGIGPTLGVFGVPAVLANPSLRIYRGSELIAENNDWTVSGAAKLFAGANAQVGAFALPSGSLDAALLLTLPPGAYTAQIAGLNDSGGNALIELYELR